MNSNNDMNDVMIAGDYDQNVAENEVRKFYSEIGVCEMHHEIKNAVMKELDKTCKRRSRPIHSIAASSNVMGYVEGC